MKFFFVVILLLGTLYVQAGTSMNQEGQCTGTLKDGTPVSFTHYSNYDGCKKISRAAVSFTSGLSGLLTGRRYFTNQHDIYSFSVSENKVNKEKVKLTFANSTDVTTGTLTYLDEENGSQKVSVPLQCEIRIYEYANDCD